MSKHAAWAIRLSLFVVFVWFGALKLVGLSPAEPLVHELHQATIPFVAFGIFYPLFSAFEVFLGILFLVPKYTKIAFGLLVIHLVATSAPLFLLPHATWVSSLVPTLTGQYIIKNVVLLAAAYALFLSAGGFRRRRD